MPAFSARWRSGRDRPPRPELPLLPTAQKPSRWAPTPRRPPGRNLHVGPRRKARAKLSLLSSGHGVRQNLESARRPNGRRRQDEAPGQRALAIADRGAWSMAAHRGRALSARSSDHPSWATIRPAQARDFPRTSDGLSSCRRRTFGCCSRNSRASGTPKLPQSDDENASDSRFVRGGGLEPPWLLTASTSS
jgi:hypothetical protein